MNRLLTLLFLLLPAAAPAEVEIQPQPDGTDYALLDGEGDTDRFDLVILGDGFTEAEQGLFDEQAERVVATLGETAPFSEAACSMNVWRINVVAAESGIDDAAAGRYVDTELGVRRGVRVLNEVPRGFYSDDVEAIYEAAAAAPDFDGIVVLGNDFSPGGTAFGDFTIMGIGDTMTDTVVHELGHSVGGLADEYDCYFCDGTDDGRAYPADGSEPGEPNVTAVLGRENVKWAEFIAAATPVPTSDDDPPGVIGEWEGGRYYAGGIWRPAMLCRMRDSSADSFCAVAEHHLAQQLALPCQSRLMPILPRFELIELLPWFPPRIRWPIPVCLSCPWQKITGARLTLHRVAGGGAFRVTSGTGRVLLPWQETGEGDEQAFRFPYSPLHTYFLEYRPAVTRGAGKRFVSFSASFEIGGTVQPLGTIRTGR